MYEQRHVWWWNHYPKEQNRLGSKGVEITCTVSVCLNAYRIAKATCDIT